MKASKVSLQVGAIAGKKQKCRRIFFSKVCSESRSMNVEVEIMDMCCEKCGEVKA